MNHPRRTALKILVAAFSFALTLIPMGLSLQSTNYGVSSMGHIQYPDPQKKFSALGWGGKITDTNTVDYYMDMWQEEGYKLIRYEAWGVTNWLPGSSANIRVKFPVLDYLVDRCEELGITVIIDPVHNYPAEEGSTIMQESFTSNWLPDLRTVAERYNNRTNVILECVNEYTKSDAMIKYQTIVDDLRGRGIAIPLHFTYHHWNYGLSLNVLPNDPLKKTSCGRHFYVMQDTNDPVMNPSETWLEYCQRIGIESDMQNVFTGTSNVWFGPALRANKTIICTEIGASWNWEYSRYNVAWCMRFLEYCQQYNVSATMFRIGSYFGGNHGDKPTYYTLAQSYFGRPFFIA